jgi:hypothetical protein
LKPKLSGSDELPLFLGLKSNIRFPMPRLNLSALCLGREVSKQAAVLIAQRETNRLPLKFHMALFGMAIAGLSSWSSRN